MLCGRKAGAACIMEAGEEGPIQEGLNFKKRTGFVDCVGISSQTCLCIFRRVVSFLFKVKLFKNVSLI